MDIHNPHFEAYVLKIAAGIIAAPRYVGAFAAAIGVDVLQLYPWFVHVEAWTGAAMAVLEGLAVAYVFKHSRRNPRFAVDVLKWVLLVGVAVISAPYLMAAQLHEPVKNIMPLPLLWLWSLVVSATPALVIAAVGLCDIEELPQNTTNEQSVETPGDDAGSISVDDAIRLWKSGEMSQSDAAALAGVAPSTVGRAAKRKDK